MNTGGRLVASLAATLLAASAGTRAAEDPLAVAASAAEAAAATPDGKKFADAVGAAFGREQAASIQACAKETHRPDLSNFHLYMQVGAGGQVEQALTKPSTNLAACVQGKVKGWNAGVPPKANAWVDVHVQLQRK